MALRNNIVRNALVHWTALRSWVGNNIDYEYDSVQFGKDEYWQLGRETIRYGKGDCEDVAILLCSLLRADGYDSDEVYVVVGEQNNKITHAWVTVKILGIWINLEPTVGGIFESTIADLKSLLSDTFGNTYRAYKFNDEVIILIESS